ncbi:hypothetical protein [Rhodoferax sp.]|uniref:hypothetical protein n=1 Tax=Rhodoferax sp. TaxID=50421 RepID=UPI0025E6CE52|nr:hypothetical protein [Rhodoferax sp.]MBU4173257.1 hypothetical protein [Gammaproteobacteria bacterium]
MKKNSMAKTKASASASIGKSGRPEILTEELARKIIRMIEVLPDTDEQVTWSNIVAKVKQKFGHELGRRVLSTKEWGGRALIAEAYEQAHAVQRQLHSQGRIRTNSTMPRQALQARIETLTAKLKVAEQTIAELRVMQYDKLDILRATHFDLRLEVETIKKQKPEKA